MWLPLTPPCNHQNSCHTMPSEKPCASMESTTTHTKVLANNQSTQYQNILLVFTNMGNLTNPRAPVFLAFALRKLIGQTMCCYGANTTATLRTLHITLHLEHLPTRIQHERADMWLADCKILHSDKRWLLPSLRKSWHAYRKCTQRFNLREIDRSRSLQNAAQLFRVISPF